MQDFTAGGGNPAHQPSHSGPGHKPPKAGHKVHYTARDGRQHEAIIDSINGDQADLTAMVDGSPQQHTAVPRSPAGGPHTWTHASRT